MATNILSDSLTNMESNLHSSCHIVWVDEHVRNVVNQRKLNRLCEIDPAAESFESVETFVSYIQRPEATHETLPIVLITSGALNEKLMPYIDNFQFIIILY